MQTTSKSNAVTATAKLTVADELAATKAALAAMQAERDAAVERARSARGTSTVQVIRETLAKKTTATISEISEACKARGVPAKSDSTIKTLRSDFFQTYYALQRAGKIVK